MSENILVYSEHKEIVEKIKEYVEKVKTGKAFIGESIYVSNQKGLIFQAEINCLLHTDNITLKVICETFDGYGDKTPCCSLSKNISDRQIASIFTNMIFTRMADIRKEIEKKAEKPADEKYYVAEKPADEKYYVKESLRSTIDMMKTDQFVRTTPIIRTYFNEQFYFTKDRAKDELILKHEDCEGNVTLLSKESILNATDNIALIFYEEIKDFINPIRNLEVFGADEEHVEKYVAARVNYICKTNSLSETEFNLTINGNEFVIAKFEHNTNINIKVQNATNIQGSIVYGYSCNVFSYTRKTIIDTFTKYILNVLDGYSSKATIDDLNKRLDIRDKAIKSRDCTIESLKEDVETKNKEIQVLKTNLEASEKLIMAKNCEINSLKIGNILKDNRIDDLEKQLELRTEELCERDNKIKELEERNNRQFDKITALEKQIWDPLTRDSIIQRFYGYLSDICEGYYKWDKGMNEGNGLEATFEFKDLVHNILIDFEKHSYRF